MKSQLSILETAYQEAISFINNIDNLPTYQSCPTFQKDQLYDHPRSAQEVFGQYQKTYARHISATSGKGYLGYVVGGATPESIAADWMVSAYDMVSPAAPVTVEHENRTLDLMKELLLLPSSFKGSLVSGGTMSNYVNLATARQWYYEQLGIDIAEDGLWRQTDKIQIFSGTAHSSVYKVLSMMGLGRNSLQQKPTIKNSESVDVAQLEAHLSSLNGAPAIIVANAGTVNTGSFDDIASIVALKEKYNVWIHIDATFGGMVACTDTHKHLIHGWEQADSITIDAHKWLNVPYDAAFQFTKHMHLQQKVFRNGNGDYIKDLGNYSFVNITPQGSRRWRSLPIWFAIHTQGKSGYKDLIERNCQQAQMLGNYIRRSDCFQLTDDIHLNIVCFKTSNLCSLSTDAVLAQINTGTNFHLTSTKYQGEFYIRATFCNWRTTMADVQRLVEVLQRIALQTSSPQVQRLMTTHK